MKTGRRLRRLVSAPLVALLLVLPIPSQADDVVMATVDWAPFYASDLPRGGFVTALAIEAFERAGYVASIDFIPWARAMRDVEQGYRDVLMGAYYSEERAETYHVSESVYDVTIGLVARSAAGLTRYRSLRDLRDYRIGVARGWANSPEFDTADYLNKEVEDNQLLNIRKLYAGRIDMMVSSFAVFRYEAQSQSLDLDDIVFVEPPLDVNGLHLMVSKSHPRGRQLIDDFDAALAEMREDGSYDRILAEMGFR